MYTYIYTYTYTYTHTLIYIYIYTHTHTYIHTCIFILLSRITAMSVSDHTTLKKSYLLSGSYLGFECNFRFL